MSARDVLDLVWLIPALPLFGAVVLLLFGKRIGEPLAGWLATAMVGAVVRRRRSSCSSRCGRLHADAASHVVDSCFTWMPAGGFHVDFGFLVDPLSVDDDPVRHRRRHADPPLLDRLHARRPALLAVLRLPEPVRRSRCSMLVLGDNFLLTFLGWEGVGLCSYLLISFWFERKRGRGRGQEGVRHQPRRRLRLHARDVPDLRDARHRSTTPALDAAAPAASSHDDGHRDRAAAVPRRASARSAQFPLLLWLPDAMEGPTPVSALIHAATMVTAGVFLLVRAQPVLRRRAATRRTVVAVGRRAHRAASPAPSRCVQNDIKKVLAYSTISQLGYMFLAVGVGAYVAAIFHMITHAFFKALLFLGAGSVIHGMHDEQDMRRMGGLRKFMPITAVDVHRRLARDRRRAARSPGSGRRTRSSPRRGPTDELRRSGSSALRRRAAHRVLHDPPGVPRLLRQRALARRRDRCAAERRRPSAPTTTDARRHARPVADGDARRPARARRRGTTRTSRRGR